MKNQAQREFDRAILNIEAARKSVQEGMELLESLKPTGSLLSLWEESKEVYQETGKTPRQLQEENEQLRQQLTKKI